MGMRARSSSYGEFELVGVVWAAGVYVGAAVLAGTVVAWLPKKETIGVLAHGFWTVVVVWAEARDALNTVNAAEKASVAKVFIFSSS
jgi:hypothetical protein